MTQVASDGSGVLTADIFTVKTLLDSGRNPQKSSRATDFGVLPPLAVPHYQRPYSWGRSEVSQLLNDIRGALPKEDQQDGATEYRVGTIITHEEEKDGQAIANIVDGQQRFLTFCLIAEALKEYNPDLESLAPSLLEFEIPSNDMSTRNIHSNYSFIIDYFENYASEPTEGSARGDHGVALDGNSLAKFANFFLNHCEVVVLRTNNLDSAFQMFDSQNTRGLALETTDLLKAFHLRAMVGKDGSSPSSDNKAMEKAAQSWEAIEDVSGLFSKILFRIKQWNIGDKAMTFDFGTEHLNLFKGVDPVRPGEDIRDRPAWEHMALRVAGTPINSERRLQEGAEDAQLSSALFVHRPIFQITTPIVNGQYFFDMAAHYDKIREIVVGHTKTDHQEHLDYCLQCQFSDLHDKIQWGTGSRYITELWHCLLFAYLDRFVPNNHFYKDQGESNYLTEKYAEILHDVSLLYKYSFLLSVELKSIKQATIDEHALQGHHRLMDLGTSFKGNIVKLITSAPSPLWIRKNLLPIADKEMLGQVPCSGVAV